MRIAVFTGSHVGPPSHAAAAAAFARHLAESGVGIVYIAEPVYRYYGG